MLFYYARIAMRSELAKSFENELGKIQIIDPHTHLQHKTPSAKLIGNIFNYHYIKMELSTVGMNVEKLMNDTIPPDERMKNAIPFIPKISNTTTWWGFMTISSALGFEGETVNDSNWKELCDVASKTMSSDSWYKKALASINISKSFLTNLPDEDMTGCDSDFFVPSLRTDEWVLDIQEKSTREKLEKMTEKTITGIDELKDCIGKVVDKFTAIKTASMAISLPPGFPVFPVADIDASGIYGKVLQGKRLSDDELKRLQSYMLYTLFEICSENNLSFQLMLGVDRKIHQRLEWDGFSTNLDMVKTFTDALNRFSKVKMIFSILNTILNHEMAIYAKTFANCYFAGHWWYTFYPELIKTATIERLQAVPYPKLIGWYSDSYYVEWTIAKIKLYIRSLSNALAEMVEDGYMNEEIALKAGKAMLWNNSKEIFPNVCQ